MKRVLFLLLLPISMIAMDAHRYPLRATKVRQQRNEKRNRSIEITEFRKEAKRIKNMEACCWVLMVGTIWIWHQQNTILNTVRQKHTEQRNASCLTLVLSRELGYR